MGTQHTPGPWRAEGWESVVVNDANGNTLVLMPGASYGLAAVKANARLIAAAPDLLAACRSAENWLGEYEDAADSGMGGVVRQLRAAIAKAEGRGG